MMLLISPCSWLLWDALCKCALLLHQGELLCFICATSLTPGVVVQTLPDATASLQMFPQWCYAEAVHAPLHLR